MIFHQRNNILWLGILNFEQTFFFYNICQDSNGIILFDLLQAKIKKNYTTSEYEKKKT